MSDKVLKIVNKVITKYEKLAEVQLHTDLINKIRNKKLINQILNHIIITDDELFDYFIKHIHNINLVKKQMDDIFYNHSEIGVN